MESVSCTSRAVTCGKGVEQSAPTDHVQFLLFFLFWSLSVTTVY